MLKFLKKIKNPTQMYINDTDNAIPENGEIKYPLKRGCRK